MIFSSAAAGYDDGEALWNSLIEQHGGSHGEHALAVFTAIEHAMTEARAHEGTFAIPAADEACDLRREAFTRNNIRNALKDHTGNVAVVCGAWHLSALRRLG